ncbi:OmpA family protein [Roseobacter sp. YSTF-M11]|uniref:OmpA family protein n=1 Tax=Roseobacter insulae TaxID=2859783 RepID=A0A9X1FXN3_9RHOB|nr:OmpA family protein [Roseobacter insulae]MBW4709187.1 OmpA family protein [Roseobacter insulae]
MTTDPAILIEQLGPLQGTWLMMLAILSLAALLLMTFDFLAPLLDRGASRLLGIFTAVFSALAIAYLYWQVHENPFWLDLNRWVLWLSGAAIIGLLAYFIIAGVLSVEDATGRKTNRGFRLEPDSRAVLNGTYTGQDARRILEVPPANEREYFRYSGNDERFVWTRGSRLASSFLVGAAYVFATGALILAIGVQAIAMSRGPVKITIGDVVQFDTGEARVTDTGKAVLQTVADDIRRFRASRVMITGYADSRGDAASNQSLSEARARAVAAFLRAADTGATYITRGKGEDTAAGAEEGLKGEARALAQAWNRRVEFEVRP